MLTVAMKVGGIVLKSSTLLSQWGRRFVESKKMLVATGILLCACGVFWGSPRLKPFVEAYIFTSEVKKIPLFAVIAQHYPELFQRFLTQAKQCIRQRHPRLIAGHANALVNQVFYPSLQKAPDPAIVAYLGALVQLYHYLSLHDPDAVLGLEYGRTLGKSTLEKDQHYQNLLMLLLEAKKKVISDAIEAPTQTASPEEAVLLLQALLEILSQKFGENVIRAFFTPGQKEVPDQMLAAVTVAFYTHIGASGEEKAGIMMRHIGVLRAGEQMAEIAVNKEAGT